MSFGWKGGRLIRRPGAKAWGAVLPAAAVLVLIHADLAWSVTIQTRFLQQGGIGMLEEAALCPDGKRVVTVGPTGVFLWDAATGSLLCHSRSAAAPQTFQLSADGTRLLAGGRDGAVLQELESGRAVRRFPTPGLTVGAVALSRNGRRALTACWSGSTPAVILWDVPSGKEIRRFPGGRDGVVVAVAFSPDGTKMLTGSTAETAALRSLSTGELLTTFTAPGRMGNVVTVAFSPDGTRVLTGSYDGRARLWEAAATGTTTRTLGIFPARSGWVTVTAFSPDGTKIAAGGTGGEVLVWDVSTARGLYAVPAPGRGTTSVGFSADGATLLTASGGETGDQVVQLWDAKTGLARKTLTGHSAGVSKAMFTPSGKEILTRDRQGELKLWNRSTGELVRTLPGEAEGVTFSQGGRLALILRDEDTAEVWNEELTRRLRSVKAGAWIRTAAISPDGKMLATAGGGSRMEPDRLQFWDVRTGRRLRTISGEEIDWISALAFTPDGKRAITASTCKTGAVGSLTVWSPASGQPISSRSFESGVKEAAFSPDGTELLASWEEGHLSLLSLPGGGTIRTLPGTEPLNPAVAFSPDGRQLLTAGSDERTAVLWDARTGEQIEVFSGHTSRVTSVAFSPDGATALTASEDGTWRTWNVEPPPPQSH